MGRAQSFDTDTVVRAALAVFWELGFEAASLPDLERATGLNRSSLYNSFGNKRGLFDAAVEDYLDRVVRPRLAPMTGPDVAPEAVVDYLRQLRASLATPGSLPARFGCLLVSVAGAPLGQDDVVRGVISGYRTEMLAAMTRGVQAHAPDLSDEELRQQAETTTGLVIAALAMARVDRGAALASLDAALWHLGER